MDDENSNIFQQKHWIFLTKFIFQYRGKLILRNTIKFHNTKFCAFLVTFMLKHVQSEEKLTSVSIQIIS